MAEFVRLEDDPEGTKHCAVCTWARTTTANREHNDSNGRVILNWGVALVDRYGTAFGVGFLLLERRLAIDRLSLSICVEREE